MALFKKWEEAWNNNDASGWFSLLHEDYQFTFHSSGNVMKKSDMTIEMMTSTMERETITNRRCIYENDDITSAMLFSLRNPSSTIRIFLSKEHCLRVARLMS